MKWEYIVTIESDDDVNFEPESLKEIIETSYDDFNDGTKIKVKIEELPS
jgi:hypothetical protein